jgi:hypothetical protein
MTSGHDLLGILASLWILAGMGIGAIVVVGLAGNISGALRRLIGIAVNFAMIPVLIFVVLAWVVLTWPFLMAVLAFQDDPPALDDDDYHPRGW